MCIVQGITEKISNTQLFIGQTNDNKQFTVYTNKIDIPKSEIRMFPTFTNTTKPQLFPTNTTTSTNNVAMILPVPSSGKATDIKIVDMSDYKRLFSTLKSYFPQNVYLNSRSSMGYGGMTRSANMLPITVHGSYDVSIVPTLDDFKNLKHEHFKLDVGVDKLLHRDYSENFSFIVCKIRDNAEYHPFGYVHPMLSDNTMFVPTKHFHNNSEDHADWDHSIYVMNGNINTNSPLRGVTVNKADESKKVVPRLPVNLLTNSASDLTRIKINRSYQGNHDFMIKCY